jgi:hypothetical protein
VQQAVNYRFRRTGRLLRKRDLFVEKRTHDLVQRRETVVLGKDDVNAAMRRGLPQPIGNALKGMPLGMKTDAAGIWSHGAPSQ